MKKIFLIAGLIAMISCSESSDLDELLVDNLDVKSDTVTIMDTVVVIDTVTVVDTVSVIDTLIVTDTILSEYASQSLVFMREEEKLARDVYLFLFNTWELSIFENIAASEQKHTDAVKNLLVQFGIQDPMTNDVAGQFEDELLQYLYDSLTELGSGSLAEALHVGALIEEVDINDLDIAVGEIENADVITVYENLTKGSRNHLRSFYSNLQNQGVTYEPQVLGEEYFYSIVNSDMENGGNGNEG
mgnify:CR=1 FL=1